jgi:serine protease AprX
MLSRVIEGIQWCITNKEAFNIKVLNLSLGSTATESFSNDPICQAVEKAWQAGIVVCAAAGNDGPQPRTIGSPGIDPLIITVGALDDMNTVNPEDEMVASFSSRGPTIDGLIKPDVLAPGTNIISLRSPGSLLDRKNKQSRIDNWYTSLSGTSMATPVCSGVVAQLLQLYPALTPDQIKTLLMKTARTLHLDETVQGAGVIDASRAANIVQSQARTP